MTRPLEIWSRAVEALRPPPVEVFSTWIERNVRLPDGLSAEPGPVKLWPPQRAIADSIGDETVERVTWLKAVRSGFTFLLACAVARHVRDDAAPVIVLMPTESDCRGIMVDDIEPLFASPSLAGLLPEPARDERGRSTLLQRFYPGGSVKAISSKAPRNLRRHTARAVYADEVDAMECIEGDPLKLAERRTLTYRNRKLVAGSSPKVEDTSLICKLYAESDQRVFEIPCPHCDHRFELLWRHIEWPEGKLERAHAVCPDCGGVIEEGEHKRQAVEAGRWRATHPEVEGHHGYRLNALVSLLPSCAWGKLAREFTVAKHDPDLLRAFTTTLLAEPWRGAADDLDEGELAKRAEPISLDAIPPEMLALTCGVDVQGDRLEVTTCGWSRDGTCFVLDHRPLWGSPDEDDVWRDLDAHLQSRFAHPRGGTLKIEATGVDCGDRFDRVLAFCGPRLSRKVLALKGVAGPARAMLTPSRSRHGARLFFVCGVDAIKTSIFDRLGRGHGFRFGDGLPPHYWTELTSERRVVRYSRGRPTARFEVIPGRANHVLDALVYCHAARSALRVNIEAREVEVASAAPPPPRKSRVTRSPFMQLSRV